MLKFFLCLSLLGGLPSLGYRSPIPVLSSRTHTSLLVEFDEYLSADGSTNIAYELSHRSLVSGTWTVSQSEDTSPRDVVYLIEVRVDPGKTVSSGFFRVGYGHSSTLPPDNDIPTQSTAIPFDATAAQLAAALSNIQGIQVQLVTRCQEGYADLTLPCPDAGQGAFQWLVFLDQPIALQTNLYILDWSLGSTWSGPGPQVQISRFQLGMVASNQCIGGSCRRNVTGLRPSMVYSFRVRVLTTSGWSGYSPSSNYVSTLEAKAPSRPPAPSVIAVYGLNATLMVAAPPSVEGVTTVLSQYRAVGTGTWLSGPEVDLSSGRGSGAFSVGPLSAGVFYEARVQSANYFGLSPPSLASKPFELTDLLSANISIDPLFGISGVSFDSVNITVRGDYRVIGGTNLYQIQYRSAYDASWLLASNQATLTSSIAGVLKQIISTRRDDAVTCGGFFKLSLGTVDPTFLDGSVTPELPFDASADAVSAALLNLKVVRENSLPVDVVVNREPNSFNGFSWTVEFHQMDTGSTLQLFRSAFSSSNGNNCFSYGDTVVIDLVSDGAPTLLTPSALIPIGSLRQQTAYNFRLVVTSGDGRVLFSDLKNATTSVKPAEAAPSVSRPFSSSANPVIGGSEIHSASGQSPANMNDLYYREGIGRGGNAGEPGGSGLCVVLWHDLYKTFDFNVKAYFYTGNKQRLSIPSSASDTGLLTFKCWGGGGGGAFNSPGGGGGFAQLTVRTRGGDTFLISVAGGGELSSESSGASCHSSRRRSIVWRERGCGRVWRWRRRRKSIRVIQSWIWCHCITTCSLAAVEEVVAGDAATSL